MPITTIAMYGARRAMRPRGKVKPSRTAAMGGTRVARIAGKIPARSVTPTPMTIETMIVRGANTSPWVGRSRLSALKSAFNPAASPRPRKSPASDATKPMTSASRTTDHST